MYDLALLVYLAVCYNAIGIQALDPEQQFLSYQNVADHGDDFIGLDKHLKLVAKAKLNDFLGSALDDVVEFENMKAHVLYMYEGVKQPAETVSFVRDNAYIDCLAITEQPSYYHLKPESIPTPPLGIWEHQRSHSPEPSPYNDTGGQAGAESFLKTDMPAQPASMISCPEQSIPMRRLTLEDLTKYRTLSAFFGKEPYGNESGAEWDPQKLYATARQTVDTLGGSPAIKGCTSRISVWKPIAEFSLSQQWLVGGTGCDLQTVEGGWQVCPSKYNTAEPVAFIFYTNHAYNQTGCATSKQWGCYNLDCPAFIQTNPRWIFGVPFAKTSTTGSYVFYTWKWQLHDQAWWLTICETGDFSCYDVGYYPISVFNGGRMSTGADVIAFGGEVSRSVGTKWGQMGSGQFAATGWGNAAVQGHIMVLYDDRYGVPTVEAATLTENPGTQCYSIQGSNQGTGYWSTLFYYGGPGAANCLPNEHKS